MNKCGNIAIFASGSGTNTQNIVNYFRDDNRINIGCILCNNAEAGVINRAKSEKIEYLTFNRYEFYNTELILNYLSQKNIDFIVLAGFLWLIPTSIINAYPRRIVNIHPSLLPDYGGKGMYGMNVHKSVYNNREKYSGITIHLVNEKYDEGDIIFQARTELLDSDTPDIIAQKVHKLEYKYFPRIIEKLVLSL